VRAAKQCARCGAAKPGHPRGLDTDKIIVVCDACADKLDKINRDMVAKRARLDALESRKRALR
jgi:hypothetical protein